jgi:peptidoglycan/xylan/chitin deacetylase (PgdA/CDA1 family)
MITYFIIGALVLLAVLLAFQYGLPFTKGLPVLMYHKISDGHADSLTVPAEVLEKHLQYLQQQGYQSISIKQLLAFIDHQQPLPPKPVLLTFDDGYLNNLTLAYPLLQKYQARAVIFLPTAYMGKTNEWDGGDELLMNYQQLKSIAGDLIEFGLHSHTHQNYKHLTPTQIAEDIQTCLKALETNQLPYVQVLAYPYGGRPKAQAVLKEMRQIFERAGVKLAFRIGNKINSFSFKSPYEVKRIDIRGTDSFRDFTIKLKRGRVKLF